MEDFSELKPKIEESSPLHHPETPQASLIDSTTDIFPSSQGKLKYSSFISPKRFQHTASFISSHNRSGSSIVSPQAKNSFLSDNKGKEFSLQKLDNQLGKIAEDFNTERNGGRETAIETFREKLHDTLRESKTFISTERSTLARQLSEDFELNQVPTLRWCAYCSKETSTEVEFKNSSKTFWASVGIFLMGGVFGCFLIPYVTNRCKDSKFLCHVCKREIS